MKCLLLFLCSCLTCLGQFDIDSGTLGLSIRLLGSSASTGNDASETTAVINPQQGEMLIALVINTKAATPDQPVLDPTNGVSWTELFDTNYLSDHRLTVWYARSASGMIGNTFTAHTSGVSQTGWAIAVIGIQGALLTGVNGVDAMRQNVNANVSAGTTITATFAALGKRTLCIGLLGANLNSAAYTAESGWTLLSAINFNTPATSNVIVYQAKNADTTCAISHASAFSGCIVGIEFVQIGNYP